VLDAKKVDVAEERPSKKSPMSDADAKKLIASVDEVIIAKGKAKRVQKSSETKVDDLRGPTGNIRAPLVRKGKRLLVGFNPDALGELLR
jgi:arsenate reductase-like glutaredoxin family protein